MTVWKDGIEAQRRTLLREPIERETLTGRLLRSRRMDRIQWAAVLAILTGVVLLLAWFGLVSLLFGCR